MTQPTAYYWESAAYRSTASVVQTRQDVNMADVRAIDRSGDAEVPH